MKRSVILLSFFLFLISCQQNSHPAEGTWIKGSEEEKLKMVEDQFRGFGVVMMEVAYRYEELYWAGKDQNWDYATHQLEEIQEALQNGIIRRPAREESANAFIETALPLMKLAVEEKDTGVFFQNFERLRMECISCHIKEDHGFIRPAIPKIRTGIIRSE